MQDFPLQNLQVFRRQTFEHLMAEDSITAVPSAWQAKDHKAHFRLH